MTANLAFLEDAEEALLGDRAAGLAAMPARQRAVDDEPAVRRGAYA